MDVRESAAAISERSKIHPNSSSYFRFQYVCRPSRSVRITKLVWEFTRFLSCSSFSRRFFSASLRSVISVLIPHKPVFSPFESIIGNFMVRKYRGPDGVFITSSIVIGASDSIARRSFSMNSSASVLPNSSVSVLPRVFSDESPVIFSHIALTEIYLPLIDFT